MKQYTTKFLKSVAAFFMIFPIGYIIFAAMLFDISLKACGKILLSPFYYVVTLCAVAAGYGFWEMRRWSWHLFVVSQIFVVYENAVILVNYAESHHKVFAFFFSCLIQFLVTYRVSKEIRVPYLFPRTRWWESNPRYRFSTPAQLIRADQSLFEGDILDLSNAGCFIKIREDFKLDDPVTVKFKIYGFELECQGRIVWMTQSAVTHPKGIGVKFNPFNKTQKRMYRSIGRRMRKISNHYRRSRYLMSPEEFLKQWQDIENLERTLSVSSLSAEEDATPSTRGSKKQ